MHKVGTLVAAVMLAAGGGYLYAQEAAPADPEPAEPDVTLSGERQASLSPGDMVAEANKLIASMQTALKKVVGLQQVARKQKDVIKLNCVNDKLLQIKQLLNIAEKASTNMHEAIGQEDESARYHEFGKIVISEQQVQVLSGEAENCIGEELVFLGPTEVDVEEPENPDDPTRPGEDVIDVEPPGYASPFA